MKGEIKNIPIKKNNKNKNKRVIYEALANKLRSSLQWRRHYIIYIGFIYIGINCKNRTTFYILSQKTDKCNVNYCTFFEPCSIFNISIDYLENYLLEGS